MRPPRNGGHPRIFGSLGATHFAFPGMGAKKKPCNECFEIPAEKLFENGRTWIPKSFSVAFFSLRFNWCWFTFLDKKSNAVKQVTLYSLIFTGFEKNYLWFSWVELQRQKKKHLNLWRIRTAKRWTLFSQAMIFSRFPCFQASDEDFLRINRLLQVF